MSSADWRIAPAKRSKKWLLTLALMPPRPSGSAAGEPIAMVTPSGRISRVQMTRARCWPGATSERYSPISRLPRGISTRLPSKPRTSRETIARAKPGRVEIERGLEHRRDQRALRHGGGAVGEDAGPGAVRRPPRRRRRGAALGRGRRRAAAAAGGRGAAVDDQRRLGGDARRRRAARLGRRAPGPARAAARRRSAAAAAAAARRRRPAAAGARRRAPRPGAMAGGT